MMKHKEITIQGMSCHHCVMAVERELKKLPVEELAVKIGSAQFQYDELKTTEVQIREAVEEAGYTIVQ